MNNPLAYLADALNPPRLRVKLMREGAKAPTRATDGSAGYDLRACTKGGDVTHFHGGYLVSVPLGVAVEIPPGWVGLMAIRSSVAQRGTAIFNTPAVIDSDFRGELRALLWSPRGTDIQHDERIAQLVIVPHYFAPVEVVEELSHTERGEGGWGSTGGL